MIRHVYERASQVRNVARVIVATDDGRIASEVRSFGGEVMLTSNRHASGTDRVGEVARKIRCDWVVNVQGDLPLLQPNMVEGMIQRMQSSKGVTPMGTVCTPIHSYKALVDPNVVKVVVNNQEEALYFSRSPIPYGTGRIVRQDGSALGKQHIGLYVYRRDFLLRLSRMPVTPLERAERLEQLRVLERGCKIKVMEWPRGTVEVNSPADLKLAMRYMKAEMS
jgi:3-deoxy-manno-octulosonate cytidylyltransferase (CMP-KDO synthetase)